MSPSETCFDTDLCCESFVQKVVSSSPSISRMKRLAKITPQWLTEKGFIPISKDNRRFERRLEGDISYILHYYKEQENYGIERHALKDSILDWSHVTEKHLVYEDDLKDFWIRLTGKEL